MPTIINALFDGVRPQYLDTLGGLKPLDGGRLIFCNAGTSTPKAIYSSAFDRLTPLTNPLILDADGYVPEGGVWLGDGSYKVFWQRRLNPGQMPEAWGDLWETDNILGVNTALNGGDGLNVVYLDTVSDLQNLDPTGIDLIGVTGYYTPNDFGGVRWFKWYEASYQVADNGMIFARTASPTVGRFIGVLNGTDYIPASWYGATSGAPYPVNSRLLALQTYCANNKKTMFLQGGTYYLDNDLTLNINGDLILDVGVVFRREASAPATIQINITPLGLNINGAERINYSSDELIKIAPISPIDLLPEWWGLDYAKMVTSGSKGRILFTQGYNIGGTTLDFSGFECYFKSGSYLNSSLFVSNRLTFGIVGSDQGATNLFRVASGEPYPFLFKNDVYARWLISDAGNYLDANHTFICISATMNGTQNGKVIFDIDFIQRGNTTDTNYTRLTNIEFRDCTISSFGTNTRYKLYANSFNGLAFVTQATPIQPIPNGDLKVSWFSFGFGFGASNATNNHLIFGDVAFFAIANSLEIDGQNLEIELLANTAEISATATAEVLTLKNMNIKASGFKINIKTSIGSTLNVVTILNSRFLGAGVNSLCEIVCKTQYSRLENCELKLAQFNCKDSAYVQNNTFLDANIFNDSGVNVHILNNFCKVTNGTMAFIYIGATLEPQKWRVIGNTYIDLIGGVAEMIDTSGRTEIFNSFISIYNNFGGEKCATAITLRNKTTLSGGSFSVVPVENVVYFFSMGSSPIINASLESLVVMKAGNIAPIADNWALASNVTYGLSMVSIPVAIGSTGYTFKITTSSAD